MGLQAFLASQPGRLAIEFCCSCLIFDLQPGPQPQEAEYRESASRARGAAGRQYVIGPDSVVTQSGGRVLSDKQTSVVPESASSSLRILHEQL